MKQKLPIIIGVGLPLLLVLWILIFAYILPSIFIKPGYDFIYAAGYENQYIRVQNGTIQTDPCPYTGPYTSCNGYLSGVNLYLYDIKNGESIPISINDAKKYTLDPSEKSPDGYAVRLGGDSSGDFYFFPFFGGSGTSQGYSISKGGFSKPLVLQARYFDIKFLGWVIK